MGFREEGTPGKVGHLVDFLEEQFWGWTLKDVCDSNCSGRRPGIAGEDRAHSTVGFGPAPSSPLPENSSEVFISQSSSCHLVSQATDTTSNLHSLVTSSQLLLLWIR